MLDGFLLSPDATTTSPGQRQQRQNLAGPASARHSGGLRDPPGGNRRVGQAGERQGQRESYEQHREVALVGRERDATAHVLVRLLQLGAGGCLEGGAAGVLGDLPKQRSVGGDRQRRSVE